VPSCKFTKVAGEAAAGAGDDDDGSRSNPPAVHVAVLSASLRFKPLDFGTERVVTKCVLPKSHKAMNRGIAIVITVVVIHHCAIIVDGGLK
jgi:hypothetical protein